MSSPQIVVYDACVLYPAPLRDLLMHLALTDLFRPKWSKLIHDEWTRSVLESRPDLRPEQLLRTRELMDANVRDCLVLEFEHLIPTIELPDPDDRHVVAAALHSGAELIVTFNLKDFPVQALHRFNLLAKHPDDFVSDLMDKDFEAVLSAARDHRRSLRNPPLSVDEYLLRLKAQGLTKSVSVLRSRAESL